MPEVCVSRNLDTTTAALGLEPWSAPRMVQQVSATSVGDGAIASTGLVNQPGRLMLDASLTWVSDSPLPLMLRLQIIRAYRTIITSNPNVVQIWDAWNHGIDETARTPDTYNLVNSLATVGVDVGTDTTAQPYYGRVHYDIPATMSDEWFELPAGSTFDVKYRAYCWTPQPWSNNASANSPLHEAWARNVKLRLFALPMADEDVR